MTALALALSPNAAPVMGGAAWTPALLANKLLWHRADQGVTVSGSDVTAWTDISGFGDSGRNTTNTGLGITRNSANAAFNNKPTIGFAGTASYLASGAWNASYGTATFTTIAVGNPGSTAANRGIFDRNNGASENVTYALAGTGEIRTFTPIFPSGVLWSAPKIIMVEWAGSGSSDTSSIYINSSTALQTSGNKIVDVMSSHTVGAGTGGAFPFAGDVAEILVVNGLLAAADRVSLVAYLAARYGIVAS